MRIKSTKVYVILAVILAFLFFSNDFGLTDIQKTALVIAVGVDRENDEFVITSQIAMPKSEQDGESSESAQIVSKGKTVADAFEQINAKTGWYPKLVFCKLIALGESATKRNVFECLNFFLRDEYLSDNCSVAVCEGSAQEILNAKTPVEDLSGLAAIKVLSSHAERVGSVLPNTLREFASSYFDQDKSAFLPIIKAEAPQEETAQSKKEQSESGKSGGKGENGSASSGKQKSSNGEQEKKVFSASETALFNDGKQVGKLNADESKTLAFVKNKLRLASYPLKVDDGEYTLHVKRNTPKTKLSFEQDQPKLEIQVTVTAGILDGSKFHSVESLSDAGEIPKKVLRSAEEKLQGDILKLFEKTKALNCDVFDCSLTLKRKYFDRYEKYRENLLREIQPNVRVKFQNVR